MSFKPQSNTQAQLKQLWGGFVPPLTPEQIDIALKVLQKIKTRKQRSSKLEPSESRHDSR